MVQGAARGGEYALSFGRNTAAAPVLMAPSIPVFAIVLIAACAHAASAAWPFDAIFQPGAPLWWLQTLALATLVGMLHRCANARQAAVLGLTFATVWLTGTFWWLFGSMHTYGGLHAMLSALAVAALALALAAYYAAACALYWRLAQRQAPGTTALFAALWLMAEMARGTWLTGFGWGAVAYAHVDAPLAGYAPWVGAYGMTALAAWLAAALATVLSTTSAMISASATAATSERLCPRGRHAAWGLGLAMALVLVLGLGALLPQVVPTWSRATGDLSVALLQGNIAQNEKFEQGSGVPQALQWYREQLLASTSDLVVAPETAIPLLPDQLPDGYWHGLQQHFESGQQAALIGIPLGSYSQGYTNSVVGLAPQLEAGWHYDKHHLVPFGEFIPPLFKWFTQLMNIPLGDFNRGAVGQASLPWRGQRLAPNICYEDLFGEELGARFTDPDTAPTIFVNVSNIGWFGNTVAIDQHLLISRMRTLEFERPMLRATNTGATVIIDHTGAVRAALPRHTRGALVGEVQGRTGTTPFAWWVARFGLWPLWLLAIAIVFVAFRARTVRAES